MSTIVHDPAVVRAAFDRLAPDYDRMTSGDTFQLQRAQAHRALMRWLPPQCRVLEIGCGTGVDTLLLARFGLHVTACDPSEAMVSRTLARLSAGGVADRVDVIACGLDDLPALLAVRERHEAFDAIVSGFGALNCVPALDALGAVAANHLRSGGKVAIGLLGRSCAWESFYFTVTGRRELAARRRRSGPVDVPVAGFDVPAVYHRPADILAALGARFTLEARTGLGIIVPPPYLETRWQQLPPMLRRLVARADQVAAGCPGLNRLGDHVLLCWAKQRSAGV
ncbi:MAG: methyltransferase domain-containing protein [Acidobacteriota bacterium]|nr:methyltransferase domain-containing protein [Acidobacteriota bacterium]